MISPHDNWIFVHIQKTGGTSIRRALGLPIGAGRQHHTSTELRALYGDDAWQRAFTFAFVRNPWDRLVSWWSMIEEQRAKPASQRNRFATHVLENACTFEAFLHLDDKEFRDRIWRNQVDYLTEKVDYVGRFERLEADFSIVATKIGRPGLSLPGINRSNHAHYSSFYSEATARLVAVRYARDIDAFGYCYKSARMRQRKPDSPGKGQVK